MIKTQNYKAYSTHNFIDIPQIQKLPESYHNIIKVTSKVLPFKTNSYVINELINWDDPFNDPMFKLTFPQEGMLREVDFNKINTALKENYSQNELNSIISSVQTNLNPHPAGQLLHNVPIVENKPQVGIQHKYDETVLFFPAQGQTCHAYCTFCFRWPQFVSGNNYIKFASKEADVLVKYLQEHKEVRNVLFTGGDPAFMSADIIERYFDAIIDAEGLEHIDSIRFGTKSLGFWPYKYTTDKDADKLLHVFEKIIKSGRQLAFMAHFSHPNELQTEAVSAAVKRLKNIGVEIRTQSPIFKHINDDAEIWKNMWEKQVNMGMIPYYMFVARDTGAQEYFSLPLEKTWEIFKNAYNSVSGICRTVRGPSMSASPGKVHIIGVSEIKNEKVFVLQFLQARNKEWVRKPFFAKYNPKALWLTDLEPAFGEKEFFWTQEFNNFISA
jgi:KamA family protein